jgi:ligand-binding sensor domain-containing protein/signal transduction histidine kinase
MDGVLIDHRTHVILDAAMGRLRSIAVWLILCTAGACNLQAQVFAGYTGHVWQAVDGLPEQTVQAFAQTSGGYLWIGTTGGLLRFDGAQFKLFDRQNTPALHENSIFCLMVSRDDALWIGTEGGGVTRYAHGQFRSWTTREGLSNDFVRALFQDSAGTIWAGTDNGLMQFKADSFVRVDGTSAIPAVSVHSIHQDRSGRLWVGGFKIFCIENMIAKEYSLGPQLSQNMVKSILQTQDGTLWAGTVSGLDWMPPGQDHFQPVQGISSTVRVLRQTPDGVLWIGTIGQGAFQFSAGNLTHVTAPAQLPSNTVLNFFEDGEKNFWIGTQTGMLRLTRSPVSVVRLPKENDSDFGTIYQDRDGSFWIGSTLLFQLTNGVIVPQNLPGMRGIHVRNIFRDRSGALWAGTDGNGLFRIAGGQTTHFSSLSNNFIRAIAQAHDGRMWIATDGGLNHIVLDGAKQNIHAYLVADGLAYPSTRALLIDKKGDLWVGTDHGVSHMRGGAFLSDLATSSLSQMKVWAIHEDSDGSLWFGTRDNGLYRLHHGKLAHFTVDDGLASNAIYQILEDGEGHFWMSGPNGISLLNRHDLDAQADSTVRHLALTFYSIFEMEGNTEIYGGTQPSGCITAKGDVWFPSSRGPIHILPVQHSLLAPPPLQLQATLADGQPSRTTGPIVLAPGNSRLEFGFAPIRLRSQDGLRFRYRLNGFDKNWSAATTARTADYTNLPPGNYLFRVQVFEVGNPDVASEASIEVVQKPHFYRTWWFIAVSAALIALVVLGAYRYRIRQVRSKFEAVLEERTRLAREMHDTVIQGCTGVSAIIEAVSMDGSSNSAGLLDFAGTQLRATINEAREAIWNLRQSNTSVGDIDAKIEGMTAHVSREFQTPVSCSVTGTPFALSYPIAHDLLMVAREAVFNALLHGKPAHVQVRLAYGHNHLTLQVIDDGCGFDPGPNEHQLGQHFGLKGMRERIERSGGRFRLEASPGKGVLIEAELPRNSKTA